MLKRFISAINLLLLPCILFAQCGKVLEVKDGDTFVISWDDQQKQRVRLAFIDAPEHQQDFGLESKNYLKQMIEKQKVCLDVAYTDPYGRLVAIVTLGKQKKINEEMLSAGMAWHFVKYSKDPRFAMLESNARKSHKGLWRSPNPIAPWVFRKQHHIGYQRNR